MFTPYWRNAEKFYLEKFRREKDNFSKCIKKVKFFLKTISENEIYPKNKWFKKFEKYWRPDEEEAIKELKKFINSKLDNYSESRNFPNIVGTSKLSPFIKHGQIHVETIWEECSKIKKKV